MKTVIRIVLGTNFRFVGAGSQKPGKRFSKEHYLNLRLKAHSAWDSIQWFFAEEHLMEHGNFWRGASGTGGRYLAERYGGASQVEMVFCSSV